MTKPTLLILCGRSPRHLYVANHLCRAGEPLAIVQEVGSERRGKKLLHLLCHPPQLLRKVWRRLRDKIARPDGGEAKLFFGERVPALERPDLLHTVAHINHPDLVTLAKKLKPDLICVFGTSIIRGELLHLGRLGLVNLHGGLSPDYRGADGTFWALYNGQPKMVGCTLHFIDAGIDTGRLIAHICPEVRTGDSEYPLFWRGVKAAATVYAELVARLQAGDDLGAVQSAKGHLYQVKDRTLAHEQQLKKQMPDGVSQGVNLPQRVKWFYRDG